MDSFALLKRRSTTNIPYEPGSVTCSLMKHPNPDKFVVMDGIPITVHSAKY